MDATPRQQAMARARIVRKLLSDWPAVLIYREGCASAVRIIRVRVHGTKLLALALSTGDWLVADNMTRFEGVR